MSVLLAEMSHGDEKYRKTKDYGKNICFCHLFFVTVWAENYFVLLCPYGKLKEACAERQVLHDAARVYYRAIEGAAEERRGIREKKNSKKEQAMAHE